MSMAHQLLTLIIIAWLGFVVISLLLAPTVLESWRQQSTAFGFILSKTFAELWILLYFTLILIAHFLKWYPPLLNRVLATLIAVGIWTQVVWFVRWQRRVRNETKR